MNYFRNLIIDVIAVVAVVVAVVFVIGFFVIIIIVVVVVVVVVVVAVVVVVIVVAVAIVVVVVVVAVVVVVIIIHWQIVVYVAEKYGKSHVIMYCDKNNDRVQKVLFCSSCVLGIVCVLSLETRIVSYWSCRQDSSHLVI